VVFMAAAALLMGTIIVTIMFLMRESQDIDDVSLRHLRKIGLALQQYAGEHEWWLPNQGLHQMFATGHMRDFRIREFNVRGEDPPQKPSQIATKGDFLYFGQEVNLLRVGRAGTPVPVAVERDYGQADIGVLFTNTEVMRMEPLQLRKGLQHATVRYFLGDRQPAFAEYVEGWLERRDIDSPFRSGKVHELPAAMQGTERPEPALGPDRKPAEPGKQDESDG